MSPPSVKTLSDATREVKGTRDGRETARGEGRAIPKGGRVTSGEANTAFLETVGVGVPFLCSLATIGVDGAPAVRFVRAKADAAGTLRIPTFAGTAKLRQIEADPRVHITCGDTDSDRPGTYFQFDGRAEIATGRADKEACWTPRLAKWFSGLDDENYVVLKVTPTAIVALPIGRSGPALAWRADSA